MVATLTNIEARMLKKDEDATVETLPYSPATLAYTVTLINPSSNRTPVANPNSNANPHPKQVAIPRVARCARVSSSG